MAEGKDVMFLPLVDKPSLRFSLNQEIFRPKPVLKHPIIFDISV